MDSKHRGVRRLLFSVGVAGLISSVNAELPGPSQEDGLMLLDDQGPVEAPEEFLPADEPADGTEDYVDDNTYGDDAEEPEQFDEYADFPEQVDEFGDGPDQVNGDAPEFFEYGDPSEEFMEYADPPEEVVGPEEMMAGPEPADPGEVDFGAIEQLGFSATTGVDYVPNAANIVPFQNINGEVVEDATACAEACASDEMCNAASFYFDGSPYGGNNCFTKTLGTPCEVPSDAPGDENAVLLLKLGDCVPVVFAPEPVAPLMEPEMAPVPAAMAPGPAVDSLTALGYGSYPGADYVPTDSPPNLVGVQNTANPSSLVADLVECAMTCDADPECSGASFYSGPDLPNGMNCWLKIFVDSCLLPADAQSVPEATLLLKQGDCPTIGAIAPGALEPVTAPSPMTLAPMPTVVPPLTPEPVDATGTRAVDIGLSPAPETIAGGAAESAMAGSPVGVEAGTDSAHGMHSAIAAVVAAAAMAVFA